MDIAGLLGWLVILATTSWGQLLVGQDEVAINPSVRMKQLLNQTDSCGLEQTVEEEWLRAWPTDWPSHLHPPRIHGGIQ